MACFVHWYSYITKYKASEYMKWKCESFTKSLRVSFFTYTFAMESFEICIVGTSWDSKLIHMVKIINLHVHACVLRFDWIRFKRLYLSLKRGNGKIFKYIEECNNKTQARASSWTIPGRTITFFFCHTLMKFMLYIYLDTPYNLL